MQQEKLNKLLQHKLEQLTEVPDDVDFNSSAAWQKLESRLTPPGSGVEKKGRLYVRFAIAALVIGIIAFSWIMMSDFKTIPMTKGETSKPSVITNRQAKEASINESLITETNERKNIQTITTKKFFQPVKKELPEEKVDILIMQKVIQDPVGATVVAEPQITNEPAQTVVAVAPKKRFRIVHINETIPPKTEIAKNNHLPTTGFPFYKSIANTEENGGEPIHEEPEPLYRKKERGLIKTLTNSIKD